MARSVSTPSDAYLIAYNAWAEHLGEDDDWMFEFDWFRDDVKLRAKEKWPSLRNLDPWKLSWAGNEDRILLHNELVEFGISEYCGLAAIWMRPREYSATQLSLTWMERIKPAFMDMFATHTKLGSMSNGEGVYQRIEQEPKSA